MQKHHYLYLLPAEATCEPLKCEVHGKYTHKEIVLQPRYCNVNVTAHHYHWELRSDPEFLVNKLFLADVLFLLSKFASPHLIILEMCFSNQTKRKKNV